MKTIPNELTKNFADDKTRKEIIEKFTDYKQAFFGKNEDGEDVEIHIAESGIILKTYQNNGWLRVNYYDENGYAEDEVFNGKWDR